MKQTFITRAPGLACLFVALAASAWSQASFSFTKDLIPANAGPALGLADFDGDGDLDLLTSGTGIYLNDGNGLFAPHPVLSAVVASPAYFYSDVPLRPVAIGDLNGDGLPDVLAATGSYTGTLVKWTNQGGGVLVNTVIVSGSLGLIRGLALGDVDGDGDLDLAVAKNHTGWEGGIQPSPMALLLNTGNGSFVQSSGLPTQSTLATQIALADFDGDGDLDLLTSGGNYVSWPPQPPLIFWNSGAGSFSQTGTPLPAPNTQNAIATGDVNGDGLVDIVSDTSTLTCTTTIPAVLLNQGGGAFQAMSATLTLPLSEGLPVLIDVDGDGKADLLRLTRHGTTVHPLGAGVLAPPLLTLPLFHAETCPGPYSCATAFDRAIGDLDGDGDQDLATVTAQGNQIVFNAVGTPPVLTRGALASARQSFPNTRATDFDGDGDVDLLLVGVASCSPIVPVAFNDGRGNLTQGPPMPISGPQFWIWNVETVDADADGDLDLFVAEGVADLAQSQMHRVLINVNGSFSPAQTLGLGVGYAKTSAIRSGDLDADGDLDLVVGMGVYGSGSITGVPSYVLRNAGNGTFQIAATLLPPRNTQDVALVDVDGDGDLDIVEANVVASALFLNDGTGQFTQSSGGPSVVAYSVATGDLDLDGDVDLLLDNAPMLNNGAGFFSAPGVAFAPGETFSSDSIDLVDVDADSFPDAVEASGRVFPNLGCGTCFGSAVPLPAALTVPIVHADFDRDGDQDLVARGPAILTNMKRQLGRKLPARLGRPASLEIGGAPGTPWVLFASNGSGNLSLPPFGTVFLDLATTQLATAGTIPAGGISTISGVAPSAPSAIGFTVYWQAAMLEPVGLRFTGLEVTTIAAY